MRSLFWCSAVVVLLAGCGGKPRGRIRSRYDTARPLAVRDSGVALSGPEDAQCTSSPYAGAGRVERLRDRPAEAAAAIPPSCSCTAAAATARTCC